MRKLFGPLACAVMMVTSTSAQASTSFSIDLATELQGQGTGGTPYVAGPLKFEIQEFTSTFLDPVGLTIFAEQGGVVISTISGGIFDLDQITLTGNEFSVSQNIDLWIYNSTNTSPINRLLNTSDQTILIDLPAAGAVTSYGLGIKDARAVFLRVGMGAFTLSNVTGAVPEPATWMMMLVGFALVGGATRYRRRSSMASYR